MEEHEIRMLINGFRQIAANCRKSIEAPTWTVAADGTLEISMRVTEDGDAEANPLFAPPPRPEQMDGDVIEITEADLEDL